MLLFTHAVYSRRLTELGFNVGSYVVAITNIYTHVKIKKIYRRII